MRVFALIADSDPDLLDLFRRFFTDHSYRVEIASNGPDCVAKLHQCRPAVLMDAARNGKVVESIAGPDRAMMYMLAAFTGFRKSEIGSLTQRSLRLDDDPPTATVAACYSKHRREDRQILHPALRNG